MIVQFNSAGAVTHVYTIDNGTPLNGVFGLTMEAETGNLYVVDSRNNRSSYSRQSTCCRRARRDPQPGNIDLELISPDGSDLQGLDVNRSRLYFWSVCGSVQFSECQKYAPQSTVCGLNIPITAGFIVARPTPPIEWKLESNTTTTTVVGTVMNGDACGRLNLQSQLIVILTCSRAQDAFFAVDDSQVSPNVAICTYILTFHTPIVCTDQETLSS